MIESRSSIPYKRSARLPALIPLLSLLPFLSALAAYYAARDAILITYLAVGATVFLVLAKIPEETRDKLYLFGVSCVSLSLFLVTEFASPYISGDDIQTEFYLFNQVLLNGFWHATVVGSTNTYSSLLSITVLPAIINIESSIDGTLIFKFLFPILYSLVPLILYKVYRQFLGPSAAFLSVFILMMDPTFYTEMLQLGRQMIAEIFLALLLLIAISKRKQSKTPAGALLTFLLSLGLITAHYSLAYIFLVLMLGSLLIATVSRRVEQLWGSGILLAWLVLTVAWFLLATGGAAIANLSTNLIYVWVGITRDFLNPASRPATVQNALFLTTPMGGILHVLNRATQYVTVGGIMIGFVVFLHKRMKNIAERQMIPLMTISIGLLFAATILPFFGSLLNFSRFFHLALIFIAPCFFVGGQWIVSQLRRITPPRIRLRALDARLLLATLVFLYFIFTSGWVWAVTRDSFITSVSIDWQRMKDSTNLSSVQAYYEWYIVPQNVAAAYWLKGFTSPTQPVCAEFFSTTHVLMSYGGRDPSNKNSTYVFEEGTCSFSRNDYVYFSEFNTLYNSYGVGGPTPISNLFSQPLVAVKNRIYSDGATIYGS